MKRWRTQLNSRSNNLLITTGGFDLHVEVPEKSVARMTIVCDVCKKGFGDYISLRAHRRRNHRSETFSCLHCSYKTKFKYHLSRHMSVHDHTKKRPSSKRTVPYLKCPLCHIFESEERAIMIIHYSKVHGVQLDEEKLDFSSVMEFEKWKKETEASGCFRFRLFRARKTEDSLKRSFRCFRDGFYKTRGEGKRRPKIKGSCKIDGVCPCSLKVDTVKSTGAVKVSYVSRHVGHAAEIGRLNLTREERLEIAEKLSQHIPPTVILDSIRGSLVDEDLSRIHLTTRKDLANIKQSFHVFQAPDGRGGDQSDSDSGGHSDDRTSVEAWISTAEKGSETISVGDLVIEEADNKLEKEIIHAKKCAAMSSSTSQDMERGKSDIFRIVNNFMESVENMQQVDAIKKALAPIPHILQALRSNMVLKPHKNQRRINTCAKISPQKPLFSTKKLRQNNNENSVRKPTNEEREKLASNLLLTGDF